MLHGTSMMITMAGFVDDVGPKSRRLHIIPVSRRAHNSIFKQSVWRFPNGRQCGGSFQGTRGPAVSSAASTIRGEVPSLLS